MTTVPQPDAVANRFAQFAEPARTRLLELRDLILSVAAETDGVGDIEETLKWNEPAYLTVRPKSGTTIRLSTHKSSDSAYALYVHCQTDLLDRYRSLYADTLTLDGDRAIVFDPEEPLPTDPVRHCIQMALTYHLK